MLATNIQTTSFKALTALKLFSDQLWSAAANVGIDLAPLNANDFDLEKLRAAPPKFFLLDWQDESSLLLLMKIRAADFLANVPVIAVVDDPWSNDVKEAFSHGVDDFIPRDQINRVEQKLASLTHEGYLDPQLANGRVVLVDPDHQSRLRYARHLRQMGLDVLFALDGNHLPLSSSVKLIVIRDRVLDPTTIDKLSAHESSLAILILGTDHSLTTSVATMVNHVHRVSFLDEHEDPAQIVFEANKLLQEQTIQRRTSKRIRFETPVLFCASQVAKTFGYSCNISAGGIYVRTLTPPAMGTLVSLEFSVPHARGRIVVEGRVAWRQASQQSGNGIPQGFGVQFTSISIPERAALEAGYYELLSRLNSDSSASV